MPFRDGSLSSFPDAIDDFGVFLPNQLELAIHMNKFFDASLNMERYAIDRLGGSIESRYGYKTPYPREIITAGNLLLSYETFTTPLTGIVTVNRTVPTQMGNDPFNDLRFGIATNTYLVYEGQVEGEGKDLRHNNPERTWNALMQKIQAYTSIEPLGGRNFRIHIVPKAGVSTFYNSFRDNFNFGAAGSLSKKWKVETNRWTTFTVVVGSLHMRDRFRSLRTGGWSYPIVLGETADHYSELQLKYTSGPKTRGGLMVRAHGTVDNASFYAMTTSWDGPVNTARLMRFTNQDLRQRNITGVDIGGGTFPILPNRYYRLSATGTTIKVEVSTTGLDGSWSSLVSATDSNFIKGRPGIFILPSTLDNYWQEGVLSCDNYRAAITSAVPVLYTARTNILYSFIGETGKLQTTTT